MNSLHDYYISKYEVFSSEKEIFFYVKYQDSEPYKNAVAKFSGVIGHHFEHSLSGNIILSLEETENHSDFYKHSESELKRYRKYGLPLNTESSDKFVENLRVENLKIFEVYSSYGLSGWVISKNCEVSITCKN